MSYKVWIVLLALTLWLPAAIAQETTTPPADDQGVGGATTVAEQSQAPAPLQETEQAEREYCGICEAKKKFNDATPWLEWGFDQRNRWAWQTNSVTLDKDDRDDEFNFARFRSRLWTKITPIENIEINARLVWEWFLWCQPEASDNTPSSDVTFDNLNVVWRNILGSNWTAIVGRQDIRLGDGWLVFEGTPLDGSRTVYFDAIRLIYDMPQYQSSANIVYYDNRADTDAYIKPFNDDAVERLIDDFDYRGAIVWLTNKSIEDVELNAYFIYAHLGAVDSSDTFADIYTVGGRVAQKLNDNWNYRVEAATQFGNVDGVSLCGAFGVNSRLTYEFKDTWENAVWVDYEYRSGDADPRANFNMLFGRYPQWSEIHNGYLDIFEGAVPGTQRGASQNLHRASVGWGCKPHEKLQLLTAYHLLFVDNNNLATAYGAAPAYDVLARRSESGCFRGQLFTALLKYKINEHLSGHLIGEIFCPGDYYTEESNDPALFARYELVFSW